MYTLVLLILSGCQILRTCKCHIPNVYAMFVILKYLSLTGIPCRERSEEFIVRAYKGGTQKATHKSTLPYWKQYLAVKESYPSRLLLPFMNEVHSKNLSFS